MSGKQTIHAREEARAIIKRACNASQDDHALIFTGTGSTSGVNLLINKLRIKQICEQIRMKSIVDNVLAGQPEKA